MVLPTQRNRLRMIGTLAHALPVTRMMDFGWAATPLARIRKHHDAAEGGNAGQVDTVGGIHTSPCDGFEHPSIWT